MSKNLSKAYVAVFVILFITPAILYLLFAARFDRADYDQSTTVEKPVFSLETIEDFPADYETYFAAHLPFRTQMIKANSMIDYFLFRQSPLDTVVIGKDEWLFYDPAGTDGDSMADYRGTNLFSPEALRAMAEHLLAVRDALRAQGKDFVIHIAPNKECIYGSNYLPASYASTAPLTRADQVVAYLQENTDLVVVYPKEDLLQAIERNPSYDFYYKTDTHWNELGGYIGAKALLDALDVAAPDFADLEIRPAAPFAGDLAGLIGLSEYMAYDTHYSLEGYGNGSKVLASYPDESAGYNYVCFSTEGADSRTLLVVRDSFSLAMMPYLSAQFDNSIFIHRYLYTPELLAQHPADVVVVQVVERYVEYLSTFSVG